MTFCPVAAGEAAEPAGVTVQASNLNMRLGPGTQYCSFEMLPRGTGVKVLAGENQWLLVRLNNEVTGWIHGSFTSNPNVKPFISLESGERVRVTASSLNIRLGPGTGYTSFDRMPGGTEARVLMKEGAWHLIRLRYGSTGWVHGGYTENIFRQVSVTATGLNFRSGPGMNFTAISVLPMGTVLSVLEESGSWLKVTLSEGREGWVASAYTREVLPSRSGGRLTGRVITLDPGHGGTNPGAVGVTGLFEKVVNLKVAEKLADYLRQEGARVVLTRSGDYNVSLAGRVNISHNHGAHIFVSIHANAHTNRSISGTETYYYSQGANASQSLRLANLVQQELVRHSGLRNIGVKHGSFYVIRHSRVPSVLAELAFLSNHRDESLLRQDSFLDGQARAMARAIIAYFN